MELLNPDKKYRPIPFWSWNDRLESEELRRQVAAMHDAGIGGYFMHARGGLLTEYMGEEWFDCVRACVDEGRKLGMDSWAYDENGWPSGFGDGIVNGLGLEYQQKYLRFRELAASESLPEHPVACYDVNSKALLEKRPDGKACLCAYFEVNRFYVDTLDGKVTDKFLEVIYERYHEKLGQGDWPGLAGFFTDEPQVSRNGIPWSFIFDDEYRKAYGGDFVALIPGLFTECGEFRRTRYRFWRLVTLLFMNNYMKKIYDWCGEHGCKITGHHVCEETYESQLASNGAVMPHYQYYHIPGMDWLCRRINPLTTPVQLASVCAQTGKKQIMSETFAMCGWNVQFDDLKWMYQWQMVHGVNLLCQHLESYTLQGIRKRDYPASLFIHQPWWKYYRLFNDYMTRVGVLLAEGGIAVDTLVLHGQSSAWLCYDNSASGSAMIKSYWEAFNKLSNLVDAAHVPFHYGDETMIAMHGSVSGGCFKVGCQSYRLLIVPQMKNFSREVFDRLHEFIADGGTVLAVKNNIEDTACMVDGMPDGTLDSLLKSFVWFDSEEALAESLHRHVRVIAVVKSGTAAAVRNEKASQLDMINCATRTFSDLNGGPGELIYCVNNDQENAVKSDVYVSGSSLERFNPADAVFSPMPCEVVDGMLKVCHEFAPAGDLLLVVRPGTAREGMKSAAKPEAASSAKALVLKREYRLEEMSDNVLTLDYCAYAVDGERKSEREYVLSIHDKLLSLKRPAALSMEFAFAVADDYDFNAGLFLVIERPELFRITVNGVEISNESCGYLHDRSFRKLDIGGLAKKGVNRIGLECVFRQSESVYKRIEAAAFFESEKNKLSYDMEIEAIYLCGQFGVKTAGDWQTLNREGERYHGDFALGAKPVTVDGMALQRCGLPFFSGELRMSQDFELTAGELSGRQVEFSRQMCNVSRIIINGNELKPMLWKPFSASLDGMLRPGTNRIEICLTGNLRNMLGPHHLEEGESYAVHPATFYKDNGVFKRNVIPWNDDFCFVEFGIDGVRIV